MSNQTPHTPSNQTPSPSDEKGIIAMKPPILPPEIYERFKQVKAMTFSKEAIETSNKALKQAELKKQQDQTSQFIEINWILLETENLWKPQNPKIKILKIWEEIKKWIPYCWSIRNKWYYNWHAAIIEAEYLWKRLPSNKELQIILYSQKTVKELMDKLNMEITSYFHDSFFQGSKKIFLWSADEHDADSFDVIGWSLDLENNSISCFFRGKSTYGFSVRCIFPEKEEAKEETKEEREMREYFENFNDIF